MKYLLDTDISVFYLRGKYNINQKLKEVIGYDNCFISEITLAELKYGAELSERLEAIKQNPKITATALTAIVGISERKVEENIAKLRNLGILKRIGRTRGYWEIANPVYP